MSISTAPTSETTPLLPRQAPQYNFTTVWGSSTWTPLVAAKFPLTWDNLKKWYPSADYTERASFFVALLIYKSPPDANQTGIRLFEPRVHPDPVLACLQVTTVGLCTGGAAVLLGALALDTDFAAGMATALAWCAENLAIALVFFLWALVAALAASTAYLVLALLWYPLCPLVDYLVLPVLIAAHSVVGLRPLQAALGTGAVHLSLLGVDHFLPAFSSSIPPFLRPVLYALPTLCVVADVWAVSVSSRAAAPAESAERRLEAAEEEVARLRVRMREMAGDAEA
ncbi:hypothetical protein JCM6882_003008 [Rhodosporidiobolus microsporus]